MLGGDEVRKQVVFIANSLSSAYKFKQVLSEFDVEIAAGSTEQIARFLTLGSSVDLVVFEALAAAQAHLEEVVSLAESLRCPLLAIVDEFNVGWLQLPAFPGSDFVMDSAGPAECAVRIRRLLGGGAQARRTEVITVDDMTVNLGTYQVAVSGEPIDFTYLEYALLTYLVQHPERTFSRDALLQSVWGFDYCGGARTVDVHVRRIRAKLGPHLAQHLETVRGVGYLWNSR